MNAYGEILVGDLEDAGPRVRVPVEPLVECPYNASHKVTKHRFYYHLPKCARNYRNEQAKKGESVLMMTCKYNWDHSVPAPELMFHEDNCKDQHTLTTHLLHYKVFNERTGKVEMAEHLYVTKGVDNYKKHKTPATPHPSPKPRRANKLPPAVVALYADGEDWLEEAEYSRLPMFSREKKLRNTLTWSYPPNLSKSERKQFVRDNEAKGLRLMEEGLLPNYPDRPPGPTPTNYMDEYVPVPTTAERGHAAPFVYKKVEPTDTPWWEKLRRGFAQMTLTDRPAAQPFRAREYTVREMEDIAACGFTPVQEVMEEEPEEPDFQSVYQSEGEEEVQPWFSYDNVSGLQMAPRRK